MPALCRTAVRSLAPDATGIAHTPAYTCRLITGKANRTGRVQARNIAQATGATSRASGYIDVTGGRLTWAGSCVLEQGLPEVRDEAQVKLIREFLKSSTNVVIATSCKRSK